MAKDTAITVGLLLDEQVLDLRIPRFVTEKRLRELLESVLSSRGVQFPKKWHIEVLGKNIRLNEENLLDVYPLSNGDQLTIITEED